MKPKKSKRAFAYALETGDLIRVIHAADPKTYYDGYVVGLSDDFVLLHFIDADFVAFNGYIVFPLREIVKIRKYDDDEFFIHRALTLKGLLAARPHNISLEGFDALLASIDAHFPLTAIHVGHREPSVCYIGRVAKLTKSAVKLRQITRSGGWIRIKKHKFEDITRIDFGGGYEDALWRISENERSLAEKAQETE